MPYAALANVKARAGAISKAWGESTDVSDADILIFLQETADEIDAAISGLSLTVPTDRDSIAYKALAGLNADGALLRAIVATWPNDQGPGAAAALLKATQSRWDASWTALLTGKHPAVTDITQQTATVPTAGSFWDRDQPFYVDPATGEIIFTEPDGVVVFGSRVLPRRGLPEFRRGMLL